MESEQRLIWCFICSFFLLIGFVIGITLLAEAIGPRAPRYSIAIDSFSGLLAASLILDPEFNMTLRVASTSLRRSACVEPGTYVEVSYRCVPLAASATTMERFCARPHKTKELIVARGVAVRLPGHVIDGLAADVRSGMEVFDVTLRRSGYGGDEDVRVASCGGRRVGNVDNLQNTCDAWHSCHCSCPIHNEAKTINKERH